MKSPIVLVHDHLNQQGGAEKVVLALHGVFPESDLFTLVYDRDKVDTAFQKIPITDSFIGRIPFGGRFFKWFLVLMPRAVESFDMPEKSVIVSSASSFAKGVKKKDDASIHICYCHTPTRYLWSHADEYRDELSVPRFVKMILPPVIRALRVWDISAVRNVDHFIANSEVVAARIKKYYDRDATVIYPPVETDLFSVSEEVDDYFVIVSRFRPYKRVDLVIKAFNKLGMRLKVIGSGEEERRLKKIAKSKNIEFLGPISDVEKAKVLSRARALIHPQDEDFGITAVEAMASGRPVIAYRSGGVLETVREGVTGIFFNDQSWEALTEAVIRFDHTQFDPQVIRSHAEVYDTKHFKQAIRSYVDGIRNDSKV
ncbi:MAG: glycosyltransferase [Patescibacteria group bacterium]